MMKTEDNAGMIDGTEKAEVKYRGHQNYEKKNPFGLHQGRRKNGEE